MRARDHDRDGYGPEVRVMRGRLTAPRWVMLGVLLGGCSARNYTEYLIEPAPAKNPALEEEEGTLARPFGFGSTTVMKVSWNDGEVLTEVQIPVLASGQRIIIEHSDASGEVVAPAVLPGDYALRVRAGACAAVRSVVEVPAGVETVRARIELSSACTSL